MRRQLSAPAPKQQQLLLLPLRRTAATSIWTSRSPVDLDVEAGSVDASAGFHVDLVYFQVTITAPSNKRVVRVPIAAGGRVRKGVAVSVREQLGAASGDQAVVASAAVATQDLADPVHILNLRANLGDLVQLRLSLVRWSSKRMRWHIQNIDHLGLNQQALNAMLHEMVALGAFACNSDSLVHADFRAAQYDPTPAHSRPHPTKRWHRR